MRVGSLIDWRSFQWHEPLVKALFPSNVAIRILATYISNKGRMDSRYWDHSKIGYFTVKSAYFVAVYNKYPGAVGRVPVEVEGGFPEWFFGYLKGAGQVERFCQVVCVLWEIWRSRNRATINFFYSQL